MTLTTQETGHMPVEVRGHVEPIVIIYVLLASMTHLWANIHWSICGEETSVREWVGG
jgi:hypothetical protein